ncbi:MAG: hypothetical protein ACE10C_07785, partial [Candidatus Binatia bacterium]
GTASSSPLVRERQEKRGSIIPGNLNFGPPAEKFIFHLKLPLVPVLLIVLDQSYGVICQEAADRVVTQGLMNMEKCTDPIDIRSKGTYKYR